MISSGSLIVGMADMNIAKDKGVLITLGLGSCVGIALYDPVAKVAGLAHCMLPDSKEIKNNTNIAKFVDLATIKLTKDMIGYGAQQSRIVAKIAGGAQMFAFGSTQQNMRIGDRNVEASERMLRRLGIRILAKDVGKNFGRTVELDSQSGKFTIKTIEHGTYTI
ncbi:chemotaxis protein CheD [uncultured Tyzzerella sp.]|uniref:chemotaxis protein CheD n=1 Tax=uncultured Tyzzerella sp. TaxID=2321398 RepID=UPI002942101D|nr:chemotaxis protein CheD [uncultured Tyzzerella sp.]